jgi:hypothetical protein
MTTPVPQCAGACTTRLAPYAACGGESTATGAQSSTLHAVQYSRTHCHHANAITPCASQDPMNCAPELQVLTDSSPAAAARQAASHRPSDACGRVGGAQCCSEATRMWRRLECHKQDVSSKTSFHETDAMQQDEVCTWAVLLLISPEPLIITPCPGTGSAFLWRGRPPPLRRPPAGPPRVQLLPPRLPAGHPRHPAGLPRHQVRIARPRSRFI